MYEDLNLDLDGDMMLSRDEYEQLPADKITTVRVRGKTTVRGSNISTGTSDRMSFGHDRIMINMVMVREIWAIQGSDRVSMGAIQ